MIQGQVCCGKPMALSFESGKRFEQCADCGLELENGMPKAPPKKASARELRCLGFCRDAEAALAEDAAEAKKAAAPKK